MPSVQCLTCDIVSEYVELANGFTQELSAALVEPMQILFLAYVGIWVVVQGYRMVLVKTTIQDIAKEFIYVVIAWILLATTGPDLVNQIFVAALKTMGAAAAVALRTANKTQEWPEASAETIGGGMADLVAAAEEGVTQVFGMATNIAASSAWNNWLPVVYAIVLVVPYFLVLIVYFSQVVVSIFRVTLLATISPFLMLGYGFGWGREMALKGIATLLSAFMVLFGATLALAIMLYGVTSLEVGAEQSIDGIASLTNPTYMLTLALGWLGTAFMTEATGMANSITGSALSNTAAGIITAGAAATGTGLLTATTKAGTAPLTYPLGAAMSGANQAIAGSIADRAQQLVQKALKLNSSK